MILEAVSAVFILTIVLREFDLTISILLRQTLWEQSRELQGDEEWLFLPLEYNRLKKNSKIVKTVISRYSYSLKSKSAWKFYVDF